MSNFNQGIPGPATLINSSSTLLYGNSASANALSVQQLGAGNVFVTSNASGRVGLFVSATSNVGVGTTSPQYPLDIGGFASSAQTLRIGATSSNACVRIMEANDTYGFSMENIATAVAGASGARMDIVRHSASAQGTPIMSFIRDNPYVGIGTTSPQNTLQVQTSGNGNGVTISGDNNTRLSFSATNTGISRSCSITLKAADSSDKSMQFWNNSTDITAGTDVAYRFLSNATSQLMSITNAGNVGIGTASPNTTLDVNGFRVTGGSGDSQGFSFTAAGQTSANWSTGSGSTLVTLPGPGTGVFYNQSATFLVQCCSSATQGQYAAAVVTCNNGGATLTQTINQIGATLSISSGQIVRLYWSFNASVTMSWTYTRIF